MRALAMVVLLVACATAQAASFTQHTLGGREYWLYVPGAQTADAHLPLVVYLHGCNQDPVDAAKGTRWNEQAEHDGFLVAYPGQPSSANGINCWNWFQPQHQRRGAGEPASIAAVTKQVIADQHADARRVYVIGASAGGAMAFVMGATYPDIYAAIGNIAGCAYPTCYDPSGTLAFQAMGAFARPVPALIAGGTADPISPVPAFEDELEQWLGTDDWADNGNLDNTVSRNPASVEQRDLVQAPQPGSGDPCVRPDNLPCPGGVLGLQSYPVTIQHYLDADGKPLLDAWLAHGATHGYTGGDPSGSFTDPLGPGLTPNAWAFLRQFALPAQP